jgi:hypothetical protein
MANQIFEISLKVRIALPEDLKENDYKLKYGQPFWLRSGVTNKFEGPYIINSDTDPYEIAEWFKQKMIFVVKKEIILKNRTEKEH